jgi:hypothetical protein
MVERDSNRALRYSEPSGMIDEAIDDIRRPRGFGGWPEVLTRINTTAVCPCSLKSSFFAQGLGLAVLRKTIGVAVVVSCFVSAQSIARDGLDRFSGFWVGDRDKECKNGIPIGEYTLIGRWTEKRGVAFNDKDPTANIVWGRGEFRISTNTEFGCDLRQPKNIGNETSFKGICFYETERVPSEVIFSRTENQLDMKIINKHHPTKEYLSLCAAPK